MATSTHRQTAHPSPTSNQPISNVWYKNYMVWIFVIGFPLFAVVACIYFLFYSIKIEDPVVRDDWYMDGKTLYADVSKDKLAHDLGLTGQMTMNQQSVTFNLAAPAGDNLKAPEQLAVEISHATQKQKDRDFIVKRLSDGSYGGTVQLDPTPGKYYIVVHDPANSWRLRAIQELLMTKAISFKPLTAFDKTDKK